MTNPSPYHELNAHSFPAVLDLSRRSYIPGASLVRLHARQGATDALLWDDYLMDLPILGDLELWGTATLAQLSGPANSPVYAVVGFKSDRSHSPLDLLDHRLCPIDGVVEQTISLIRSIESKPLRDFVEWTLFLKGAFPTFWTCPG